MADGWIITQGQLLPCTADDPDDRSTYTVTYETNYDLDNMTTGLSWYVNEDDDILDNHFFTPIALFKEEFPKNKWSIENNQLTCLDEKSIAKFKHYFPKNVWKIDNTIINKTNLNILYEKEIGWFKVQFPTNVYRIESHKFYGEVLKTGTDYPEIFGGFANAKFSSESTPITLTIPKNIRKIGSEAFRASNLAKIRIPVGCEYEDTSFPAGCIIETYTPE